MTDTPYADHAWDYRRAGWDGVLPLPTGQKQPVPAGYTGRRGGWPTPADVQTWIDFRPDLGNIALRLPDTVVGIDVDAWGDKHGDGTLTRLEDELGQLPHTVMSTSRTDGTSGIRLYRVADPAPSWSDPGPGIEIIHHGWRYIVAWPSTHPDTGDTYQWVDTATGEILHTPPSPSDLPKLPETWHHRLSSEQAGPDKTDATHDEINRWLNDLPPGPPCSRAEQAHDTFAAELSTAIVAGGSRHNAALKPVGGMVRAAERGHRGMFQLLADARDQFVAAVTGPGDGRRTNTEAASEWRRLVAGAYQIVKADPTPEDETGCLCPTVITTDHHTATQPPQDTSDHDTGGDTLDDQAQPEEDAAHAEIDRLYPPLDWPALWDAGLDDVDWLIEGLVERQRHCALYAPAKTGKSLFALEMAACIATGQDFAGLHVPQPADVIYIDKEMTPGDVIERLKSMGFGPDELDRLHYFSLPSLPALDHPEGGKHLLALARRWDAQLIVLDTASRVVQGAENDADTYRAMYQHTGRALKAAGIAVWRLDHAGKVADRGQRGSSGKNDDVDTVWKVTQHRTGNLQIEAELRRTAHGIDTHTVSRDHNDGRLHAALERHGISPDVAGVVDQLDDLDIDVDWGKTRAGAELRDAGHAVDNNTLMEAIRHRRRRANFPTPTILDADADSPADGVLERPW